MKGKKSKNQTDNNEQEKKQKKNNYNKKQDKIQYIYSLLNLEPYINDKEKQEINKEKNLNITEKIKNEKESDISNKIEKEKENEYNNNNKNAKNSTIDDKDDINNNELKEYIKEVRDYLEIEKSYYIKDENEKPEEINKPKLLKKKYSDIEVEENINNNQIYNVTSNEQITEVKDQIFKIIISNNIEENIYYEGKLFNKDRHQNKYYPNIVKYRCKNYRKNEKTRDTTFCNALIYRKIDNKNYYFKLDKDHTKECLEIQEIEIKTNVNLIGSYNEFINKCMNYLDSTEYYNKKELTTKLQDIYNENKYNFKLKENTIKNIIGRWKNNSLRFTKYAAIENKNNKKGELRLYDYTNTVIYTSNKKNPISAEYFIWTSDQIIARIRKSKHLFIDSTFHHPKNYTQLMIIIFKDFITAEYYPGFYILMSNKTEILYDLILKSISRIITQQEIYKIDFITITTDTELALINAINNNFPETKRLGCWFHLSQDLIREARIMGLLNSKSNKINVNTTYEIITQLSLLPLEYKGDMEILKEKLNIILVQYPEYYNYIVKYFIESKLKYFRDGNYDYSKFPPDIRSNSILERYNKLVKTELGEKRTCNWVVFMNFINKEIDRINGILGKNENINVLYSKKNTKFGTKKFNHDNTANDKKLENDFNKVKISDKWLKQKINNCRYNAYITLFYFIYSSFVKDLDEKDNHLLTELNKLILNLAQDVSDKNYNNIVIFLQKNNIDSNNNLIDQIIRENDEEKKAKLIENMQANLAIDNFSSGYIVQLFSIFKNNPNFCLKEKKFSECIICGKKNSELVDDSKPFIYVNKENIKLKNIFNILLEECKEKYIYDCECRKNSSEDLLCTKVKYMIESYPNYLNVLFDMSYHDLVLYKDNVFKIAEDTIILGFKKEYKLKGIISLPSYDHYICIIFNPIGKYIDNKFKSNYIYYHDGTKNEGKICMINYPEDWKDLGIPYILVYEMLKN